MFPVLQYSCRWLTEATTEVRPLTLKNNNIILLKQQKECIEEEGRDHLRDSLQGMHWSKICVLLKSDVMGKDHLKYVKRLIEGIMHWSCPKGYLTIG